MEWHIPCKICFYCLLIIQSLRTIDKKFRLGKASYHMSGKHEKWNSRCNHEWSRLSRIVGSERNYRQHCVANQYSCVVDLHSSIIMKQCPILRCARYLVF